jgi:uncharacterized RDD family membrane protein YckC
MEELPTFQYAGFWLRFAAMMIDVVLLTVVISPLLLLIYGLDTRGMMDLDSMVFHGPKDFMVRYVLPAVTPRGTMDVLIQWVLPAIAAIVFWKYRSATPGKMILSLRIVDARTGGRLSVGQCIGRYFAYLFSTLPAGLGFLSIAFDKRKQAWHDKLAGTVVICAK